MRIKRKLKIKVNKLMLFINRDLKRVTKESFKREYDKKVIYETR